MENLYNIFVSPGHDEFTYKTGAKMIKDLNMPDKIFKEFNNFNIKVAEKLIELLKQHKEFKIHQLEQDNNKVDMTLLERIKYCNKYGTSKDLIIAIHANYNDNFDTGGQTAFYGSDLGKKLINLYIKNLPKNSKIPYKQTYKCVKQTWTSFGIVLNTNPVSVLFEYGFFSNAYDRKQLLDEKFRQQCAEITYIAICEYYNISWFIKKNKQENKQDIEQWKIKEYEEALKNKIITDKKWKEELNKNTPVWASLAMMNNLNKKIEELNKKIDEFKNK